MMLDTAAGTQLDVRVVKNYFKDLVNRFFKVLPMRENSEKTLVTYLHSLQLELLGCQNFVAAVGEDSLYLTLLSILQYLIDNPDCGIAEVRREVFRAISICNKLQSRYLEEVSK